MIGFRNGNPGCLLFMQAVRDLFRRMLPLIHPGTFLRPRTLCVHEK